MTDRLSPDQRHRCMSHIRSRNTKPERKVRQWLWNHGYRYRLCVKSVPGSPDIVMRKYRTAIFVNGCFWHGHNIQVAGDRLQGTVETHGRASLQIVNSPCCKIPNTNREFWVNKIRRNQERDQRNYQTLRDNGWQVLVVWECQLSQKNLEQTMLQVEIRLHDFYLKTFNRQSKKYIPVEEDLPIAAEEPEGYNG